MYINYQRIFWGAEEYIPKKVQEEYILRWSRLKKISREEFLTSISKDDDREFWFNVDYMFKAYDSYILGYINDRYPQLPISPRKMLLDIIEESNKMINFK